MTTHYLVRFVCYQHNSGRADNGFYPFQEKFKDLAAAQAFAEEVKRNVKNGEFASRFVWSGYVEKFDGIYEVTERKL